MPEDDVVDQMIRIADNPFTPLPEMTSGYIAWDPNTIRPIDNQYGYGTLDGGRAISYFPGGDPVLPGRITANLSNLTSSENLYITRIAQGEAETVPAIAFNSSHDGAYFTTISFSVAADGTVTASTGPIETGPVEVNRIMIDLVLNDDWNKRRPLIQENLNVPNVIIGGPVINHCRWHKDHKANGSCFISKHYKNTHGYVPEDCRVCPGKSDLCRARNPEIRNRSVHGLPVD